MSDKVEYTLTGLINYGRVAGVPQQGATAAHMCWLISQMVPHLEELKRLQMMRGREVGEAVAFLVTDAKGKKFTIYNALLAEAIRKIAKDKGSTLEIEAVCPIPTYGWFCTRGEGHEGPCAAWPNSPTETCPTCGGPATRREVSGAFEMRDEWSFAAAPEVTE